MVPSQYVPYRFSPHLSSPEHHKFIPVPIVLAVCPSACLLLPSALTVVASARILLDYHGEQGPVVVTLGPSGVQLIHPSIHPSTTDPWTHPPLSPCFVSVCSNPSFSSNASSPTSGSFLQTGL
ncbi:hypothetical protein CCHR01_17911 [Colletotrichum chrysophilum]|uniref:Uncharacterized protein n=1 Tax=Colletotrichum chrysophilum TaxID=1836956 RepID=A0AAD9E8M8_9PEZI|nr:hypothetical protein K456DRAFT_905488 [Colletotrichum gloeosporioides 23]KAK1839460.1 hypothetical protein CCHR01_17911 [Colletotrichum chrysophilum]